MRKILMLWLVFVFPYSAYPNENICTKDVISINAFNNFILVQEQSFGDSLKKSSMHINSEDDYINDNSHVEFDDCGALLKLRGDRIIKSRNKDGFLVTKTNTSMDKKDKIWRYNMTFEMYYLEQGGSKKDIMKQEMAGVFLTDVNGKINKSEDTSNIFVGKAKETGRAETVFLIDDKDRVSESNRVSTLKNDSGNTVYHYDALNRLIQTKSDATTVDLNYGNDNRELGSKKVQKFFTTETTTTICDKWNEFGRCTNAKQNISTSIENNKDGKEHVYNHNADVKYNYVY
ncbi:hypothetical protein [Serratia liquefaciens]|uniref:hypothetical protein n=1 Tax=Serratia liquefaciens TaxID=614 RepID=UPI0021C825FB|nr:hypothetical protein [Serratia liquefaciens]